MAHEIADSSSEDLKAEDYEPDLAGVEGLGKGHIPDKEELEGCNHPPMPITGKFAAVKWLLFEGGTPFDAFLTAASAQVGQVILTLPHSLAQTNIIGGTILQLTFATWAMYTLYLMVMLYLDYKNRCIKAGTWYDEDGKGRAWNTQYFEMIGGLTCKPLSIFTLVVCIFAALGSCLPQIVASSSNVYRINENINKRDWAIIFGGIMTSLSFVPSFRNMRIFAIYALIGTTFTAWYMTGTSIANGVDNSVWTAAPYDGLDGFFDGLTNILFTFGGHFMLLEVLDSMYRPAKFHKVFACSYSYVFTLTIPNSVLTYWAFPAATILNGNAFAVYPASGYRTTAIILMIGHQMVAFLLFIMPVFYMWEKALKIHDKPYYMRLPLRLPVAGGIWLLAVAFPYYNIINSILGAFTTSFETYLIPTGVFLWVYRHKAARDAAPKAPTKWIGGWLGCQMLNLVIFVTIAVCGVGFGMYAAIKSFVQEVNTFGIFPACYQC